MNIYSLPEWVEVNKMPNRDGTGPEWKGPKTGGQMGDCEEAEPAGRGLGPCCGGMRRRFRRRFSKKSPKSED